MAQKVYLKKSAVVDKTPAVAGIEFGELAINYASGTGKAFLATKKYNGTIAKFHEDAYFDANYAKNSDITSLDSKINSVSGAVQVINNNYVTKALLNTTSGAAVLSAYTMSKGYTDSAITNLEIKKYLTVASANTKFNEVDAEISTINTNVSALTQALSDDEYVIAQAFNDINTRLDDVPSQIASAISGFTSGNFLTVASAHTRFNELSNADDNLGTRINVLSGTVSGTYATKAVASGYAVTAKSQVIGASTDSSTANTIYGAKKYADEKVKTLSGNVETVISGIESKFSNYALSSVTNTQIANASARSVNSAVTYVNSQVAAASARTVGSAKTYADATFLKIASASTKFSELENADDSIKTLVNVLSGTVSGTYATKAVASGYAVTAKSQVIGSNGDASTSNTIYGAKKYTDEKVKSLSGNLLSEISGIESKFSNYALSSVTNNQIGAASARSVASAVVYTNSQVGAASARTVGSAKTYADNTFLTISSANTRFSELSSEDSNLGKRIDVLSGTVSGTYATKAVASGYAVTAKGQVEGTSTSTSATTTVWGAKKYAEQKDRELSGNVVSELSNISSKFSNYALSSVTNNQIGAASARSVSSAVTYTNSQVGAASARTVGSAKTYADATFLTKVSAGTMYNNLTQMIDEISSEASESRSLNFSADIGYNPKSDDKDTYVLLESSNSSVTVQYISKEVVGTGDGAHNLLKIGLNAPYVKQTETVGNAFYPIAIAARQYANMGTGVTSQIYYSQNIQFNPSTGTLKVNDVLLNGASAVQAIQQLKTGLTQANAATNTLSGSVVALSASVNTKLSSVYHYKGTKASCNQLPSNPSVGDVWNVTSASGATPAGTNWAWTGSEWDALGGTVDLSSYATTGYVDGKVSELSSAENALGKRIDILSGTVSGTYATKAVASGYAVTAKSQVIGTSSDSSTANTIYGAKKYADEKVKTLSGNVLTEISGIQSKFSNYALSSVTNTQIAAASARSVSSAVTYINSQVAAASARTVGSAKTYADATFQTKQDANSVYNELTSDISDIYDTIDNMNSTFALSSVVKTEITQINDTIEENEEVVSAALNDLNNRINAISGNTGNFLTVASAHTRFSELSSADNTLGKRINVLSGTVSGTYATKAVASGYAVTALESANAYTDSKITGFTSGNFLTVASAHTRFNELSSADNNLGKRIDVLSGTVSGTYATKAVASGYAVTAKSQVEGTSTSTSATTTIHGAKKYAEQKDRELSGHVVTAISQINSKFSSYALSSVTNTQIGAASARSVNSAVTYVNSQVAAASARTVGSAKTYADATFLTISSASSKFNSIDSNIDSALQKANSAYNYTNAVSATVKSSYWNSATTAQKIGAAVTSAATCAVTYGNNTFVKHDAYSTFSSSTNSSIDTLGKSISAVSATVKSSYVALAGAQTISGVKTFSNGYNMVTAASFTSSYRTIPFASTATAQTTIMYVKNDASTGLMFNPNTGKLRAGGFVVNNKTGNDLLTANGGTMSKWDLASSASVNTIQSNVNTVSGSVVALSGAVNTKLSTVYSYKGTKASCSQLPSNPSVGDVWNVTAASGNTPAGTNWAWTGSEWDALGGTVDLSSYLTKASAGTMYSSLSSVDEALRTSINVLSATVSGNYATITDASSYAAAALGNAMAYTDSKVANISTMQNQIDRLVVNSGSLQSQINQLGSVSATMKNQIDRLSTNSGSLQSQINQLGAVSATMKNQIDRLSTNSGTLQSQINQLGAVSATMKNQIDRLSTNSGSMYTTLTGHTTKITTVSGNVMALSAAVIDNYATEAEASSYAAAALANAIDYTDEQLGDITTKVNLINGKYISAVTYTTAATTTSITNNTLTIPKPKVLTFKKNGATFTNNTYDGTAARTIDIVESAVTQSRTTTNNYRGLLMTSVSTSTQTAGPTATTTGQVYMNEQIYANASTGKIYAKGLKYTNGGLSNEAWTTNGGSIGLYDVWLDNCDGTICGVVTTEEDMHETSISIDCVRSWGYSDNYGSGVYMPLLIADNTYSTYQEMVDEFNDYDHDIMVTKVPSLGAVPSEGELIVHKYTIASGSTKKVSLQYNPNTEALDFVFN